MSRAREQNVSGRATTRLYVKVQHRRPASSTAREGDMQTQTWLTVATIVAIYAPGAQGQTRPLHDTGAGVRVSAGKTS